MVHNFHQRIFQEKHPGNTQTKSLIFQSNILVNESKRQAKPAGHQNFHFAKLSKCGTDARNQAHSSWDAILKADATWIFLKLKIQIDLTPGNKEKVNPCHSQVSTYSKFYWTISIKTHRCWSFERKGNRGFSWILSTQVNWKPLLNQMNYEGDYP